MNTSRGRALLAILLTFGLLAAACSGDDSSTTDAAPPAPAEPAPAP